MGTNTIPSAVTGNVIPKEHHNSVKEALAQDHVPRDVDGIATAVEGSLGTSSFPWLQVFFGAVVSALSIRDVSGKIGLYVGGLLKTTIGSSGIEAGSYAPSSVTTNDINNGAITKPKLASANYQISSGSGFTAITSTSFVTVTNQSVTITTNGRPVLLMVTSEGQTSNSTNFAATIDSEWGFFRDSTQLSECQILNSKTGVTSHLDTPTAGTYTYTIKARHTTGAGAVGMDFIRLLALEL